jgi:L-aspartate oxidase
MTLTPAAFSIPRSIVAVDIGALPSETTDVIVVGSGIAGLTVASSLADDLDVVVVTKGSLGEGSTRHAQGGVAASMAEDDTPDLHLLDTLTAGSGLCDADAVRVLVDDAADAIGFLERSGVQLDADDGGRAFTREGGHSRRRVVHAGGDATGAEIVRALLTTIRSSRARLAEGTFLCDLLTDADGAVCGALLATGGKLRVLRARAVVLASGGYGQLFAETTSPVTCTGDGAAAALRAGAQLADIEFVQFHPTTLHVPADPRPLISEAMRGEGAVLRDQKGASVTAGVHLLGDLAPRDVVSRAMVARMSELGVDHLFLDATSFGSDRITHRFPTIVAACRAFGIDPAFESIPVSPAAHYTMGGVRTDLSGRASLSGLYAVGEVAESGVHGANRLASNSLLEGVVFGRRAAAALVADKRPAGPPTALPTPPPATSSASESARTWLRRAMVDDAGVVRHAAGLERLAAGINDRLPAAAGGTTPRAWETANLFLLGAAVAVAADRREESRGAHFRSDHPAALAAWQRRQLIERGADGVLEMLLGPIVHTDQEGLEALAGAFSPQQPEVRAAG